MSVDFCAQKLQWMWQTYRNVAIALDTMVWIRNLIKTIYSTLYNKWLVCFLLVNSNFASCRSERMQNWSRHTGLNKNVYSYSTATLHIIHTYITICYVLEIKNHLLFVVDVVVVIMLFNKRLQKSIQASDGKSNELQNQMDSEIREWQRFLYEESFRCDCVFATGNLIFYT